VKDAAAKKREKYEKFLSEVKLLQSIDSYEKTKLADGLQFENYNADDVIISEVRVITLGS
jgi:cAMP-dependent protein kinase regulator